MSTHCSLQGTVRHMVSPTLQGCRVALLPYLDVELLACEEVVQADDLTGNNAHVRKSGTVQNFPNIFYGGVKRNADQQRASESLKQM